MSDRSVLVVWETFESSLTRGMCEHSPQTFSHEDEDEMGEPISLPYTTWGVEGFGGDFIDENREEGSVNKTEDPSCPGAIETKWR